MRTDQKPRGLRARARRWLPEREIFLRSGGEVCFVRIGTRLQLALIVLVGGGVLLWAAVTVAMLARHAEVSAERAELRHERAAVGQDSAKLDNYAKSAAGIASELETRQRVIEDLVKSRLGPLAPAPQGAPAQSNKIPPPQKVSDAVPTAADMRALEARQDAFAREIADAFDARSDRAAGDLRALGLDPDAMLAQARAAQGGPLLAIPIDHAVMTPTLRLLARSVERLGVLEDTLVTLPSDLPTHAEMVTSSFGMRTDPFTGALAFHPGLDFRGSYGQAIFAAADGRVSFVGDRNGYGHVVEIDHGHGIMTRYAHLSGFDTHPGVMIRRGQQIARMGSTGRSTGTHLHFEMRLDNKPLDPRRFLAPRQDPFDVQQVASSKRPVDGHRS